MSKVTALKNYSLGGGYRAGSFLPRGSIPDIDKLSGWIAQVGCDIPPILLACGTESSRATIYRLAGAQQDGPGQDWVTEGLINNLTRRVRTISGIRDWDILWRLLSLNAFEISESQRYLIDQGHLITEMFKMIWEARFCLNEGRELQECLVRSIAGWIQGPLDGSLRGYMSRLVLSRLNTVLEPTTSHDRLDLLFFLISLAQQNGLVDNLILVLDGLERVLESDPQSRLKELADFCVSAERWSRLGTHIGFIIGHSDVQVLATIQELHPRLGIKLQSCVKV